MSVRVNMLVEGEARYQGPVSRTFIFLVSGSVLGLLILVIFGVTLVRSHEQSKELTWARGEWQKAEPRFKLFTEKQAELTQYRNLEKELDQWNRVRLSWGTLLLELQTIVPSDVQLSRLSARADWSFQKPAAAPPPAEGEVPPPEGEKPKVKPPVPVLKPELALEGRSAGEMTDEVVVQFVRTFRDAPFHSPLFESVRLQRLQMDSSSAGGSEEVYRVFQIEGRFLERKLE